MKKDKMRAIGVTVLFLILQTVKAQTLENATEQQLKLIKLCEVCTCGEILDTVGLHVILNIQCSELDKIENVPDLDKIEWPENPNGLKISAAFEGLGLSTLGKLPPNSLVETTRFSNNAIKAYWPDPLSDLPNLKKVSFSRNEITEITPDLFTDIELLEDLDLSYNRISNINPLDFKSLSKVKRLNLQSNMLKKIPLTALQPMYALEDLDLSKNGIYDIVLQRSDSESLKNLKRLSLKENRIRSVMKDSFPPDNKIEYLDLSNNIIEMVETEAFLTCTNLRDLNLAQNNITLLFTMPPNLQIAILKINYLYHWPMFPAGIIYVDLSYNKISEMYDERSVNFDHLEVLNIAGNKIKEINIKNKIPKLFTLDISYNLITEVPMSLNSLVFPSLEELRLDGNPIETIYFRNMITIKSLSMNELNRLTKIEGKAFSNLIGRETEMDDKNGCFSLYLSNCPSLNEIEEGAFDGASLCMLDISSNNLTHLSKGLLPWSSLSDGADLQDNPWHCSCDLQWLLDDLLPLMYYKHSTLLTELRCGSPRAVQGLRLVHWYNWTERAMCDDAYVRSGPHGNYMLEPSTENTLNSVSSLTLILGASIIVSLLIAIALSVYLCRSKRRHRIRQAALKRKRQSAGDAKNTNGFENEQFSALNKV